MSRNGNDPHGEHAATENTCGAGDKQVTMAAPLSNWKSESIQKVINFNLDKRGPELKYEEAHGPPAAPRRGARRRGKLLCESAHARQHLAVSHHIANLWPWKQRVDVDDPLRRETWTINLWPEQRQGEVTAFSDLTTIWLRSDAWDLDCWPVLNSVMEEYWASGLADRRAEGYKGGRPDRPQESPGGVRGGRTSRRAGDDEDQHNPSQECSIRTATQPSSRRADLVSEDIWVCFLVRLKLRGSKASCACTHAHVCVCVCVRTCTRVRTPQPCFKMRCIPALSYYVFSSRRKKKILSMDSPLRNFFSLMELKTKNFSFIIHSKIYLNFAWQSRWRWL